mmetsp:Transcript_66730/g.145533  ORF Transcript_66730/g.145533 Transcript_66730/m.145533 type:complete len:221 (-) Transcript_66730:34-696(-)
MAGSSGGSQLARMKRSTVASSQLRSMRVGAWPSAAAEGLTSCVGRLPCFRKASRSTAAASMCLARKVSAVSSLATGTSTEASPAQPTWERSTRLLLRLRQMASNSRLGASAMGSQLAPTTSLQGAEPLENVAGGASTSTRQSITSGLKPSNTAADVASSLKETKSRPSSRHRLAKTEHDAEPKAKTLWPAKGVKSGTAESSDAKRATRIAQPTFHARSLC